MMSSESSHTSAAPPEVSFVMPCYNEEAIVAQTIQRTLAAFRRAGYRLQLVAVDNGSRDRTGEILASMAAADPAIVPVRVETNIGYGNGILSGIPYATAPWVGTIPADGQVDAEDAVRLYEDALAFGGPVLCKARRRFRMDGFQRKVVSIAYNTFFRMLWPGVASLDINGLPKLLPRDVLMRMGLQERQWFLDPEIMLKAYYMGIPIREHNAFSRLRGNGLSHVKPTTCWEFFVDMVRYRFGGALSEWKSGLRSTPIGTIAHAGPGAK
jgi:glycosyltransferase involved in cell wall biosynthesis